jgi:hypothetical protein
MKAAALALASALAISSTCAFAHAARDNSSVTTYPIYGDAGSAVVSHPKYRTLGGFSGTKGADPWGHWGAYYGPMISTGGGR